MLALPLLLAALAPGGHPRSDDPRVPNWADLIEAEPSSKLVKDLDFRKRIKATGLAWRVRDRETRIEMLLVPPGTYNRGASPEVDRPSTTELPRHTVTISEPFYLGRYEVQEKEWDFLFDGVEPKKPLGLLISGRTYDDVEAFLRRANATRAEGGSQLRTPTEGEWEYACRAGTTGACYGKSLSSCAWFDANAGKKVHTVGDRAPNPLGFSDMLGNVWEWCSDFYDPSEYERMAALSEVVIDPTGSERRSKGHTLRGGSIYQPPSQVTASMRARAVSGPEQRPYGFRVASNP